jgi:hypothetical protein
MHAATYLNLFGLFLDFGGAIAIFIFPPPPDFEDAGGDPIGPKEYFDRVRTERREQFKRSNCVSRWCMLAIAIGFMLQLLAAVLA